MIFDNSISFCILRAVNKFCYLFTIRLYAEGIFSYSSASVELFYFMRNSTQNLTLLIFFLLTTADFELKGCGLITEQTFLQLWFSLITVEVR